MRLRASLICYDGAYGFCCFFGFFGVKSTLAQELEPRSYVNIPIGLNFLVLGVGSTEGEVAPSPSAPIKDAYLEADALLFAYAHSFELAGQSANFDLQTSRACYDGSAQYLGERHSVKLYASTGLVARVGSDFDSWSMTYQ